MGGAMHLDAEHSLFFERRPSVRIAASSLALTISVLVVNAGARSTTVSLAGAGVGALLLVVARFRGRRRVEPAAAWALAIVVAILLGGVALSRNAAGAIEAGTRVLCGVVWILWVGTQVDWASLRQILNRLGVAESVTAALDQALLHGILTQREWARRRDAARLRLGMFRLPVASWGPLLGEGALQAFLRLEWVQENAMLRGAPANEVGTDAGIHLEAIDVERGGRLVLEQLQLRLEAAEWLIVCGPSGAGKSSFLRLLAGLDAPARGTMARFGNSVSPDATLRGSLDGRVALLSQNPEHHFIASTVAEDIAWGLSHRGVEAVEAERRSRDVATSLRIDHLWERPCHELSFGEQRRVALAGLLVLEPALLLLDEPTAGLDPVAAHELCVLVEELIRRTRAACVWATHDLHSLPANASRLALLHDRKLIFDGRATEGLSKPWLIRAGMATPEPGEQAC